MDFFLHEVSRDHVDIDWFVWADAAAGLTATLPGATDSVRQTAAILHRHHSTIPTRLGQAQKALGFPPNTPAGRFRLQLALMLRRLRDNPR